MAASMASTQQSRVCMKANKIDKPIVRVLFPELIVNYHL